MSLRALSPNQFALPGMEHLAHPLAGHVAAGVHFTMEHPHGEHELTARSASGGGLGSLAWAGKHGPGAQYPGEISTVVRHPATPKKDFRPGLMTDLYKAGHQLNMGQDTVPVHSPTRTEAGEAWSKKVGGPRPERHDWAWRPPAGIHPFEQRNIQPQQFKTEGQMHLFLNRPNKPGYVYHRQPT
jgi:hypothetical protein